MGRDMVRMARELASTAHARQVDKAGAPYIEHPRRVAARVAGDELAGAQVRDELAVAVAVAWLHDVVEDTDVTAEVLRAAFPEEVVAAVLALTRRVGEELDVYYARVAANPLALRVKRADIADNTDPARTAALTTSTRERLAAKYAHAVAALDALVAGEQRVTGGQLVAGEQSGTAAGDAGGAPSTEPVAAAGV